MGMPKVGGKPAGGWWLTRPWRQAIARVRVDREVREQECSRRCRPGRSGSRPPGTGVPAEATPVPPPIVRLSHSNAVTKNATEGTFVRRDLMVSDPLARVQHTGCGNAHPRGSRSRVVHGFGHRTVLKSMGNFGERFAMMVNGNRRLQTPARRSR